jgi:hypothetical protein
MFLQTISCILIFAVAVFLAVPLGKYLSKVYNEQKSMLDFLEPLENRLYRFCRINVTNLMSNILYLTLAFLFFFLFRPVNKIISLIAAIVSAAGCVIGTIAIFDPVTPLTSPLWFFGPYCLLIGYLIFRSTFLPRILGVLMALAGVGWLIYLSPLEKYSVLYIEILWILTEASLMLWLIVKGVNKLKWEEAFRIMPGSPHHRPSAAPKPNSAPH